MQTFAEIYFIYFVNLLPTKVKDMIIYELKMAFSTWKWFIQKVRHKDFDYW